MLRPAALALVCAALGAAAALGLGRASGLVAGGSPRTVVVRAPAQAGAAVAVGPGGQRRPVLAGPDLRPPVCRRRDGVLVLRRHRVAGFGLRRRPGRDDPHECARDHERRRDDRRRAPAHRASSSSSPTTTGSRRTSSGSTSSTTSACCGWRREAHALAPLPLGRSATVVAGEPVAAIGSPLGNTDSLAAGIVSAVGRSIAALTTPHFQLIDAIQTDAPLAHGSLRRAPARRRGARDRDQRADPQRPGRRRPGSASRCRSTPRSARSPSFSPTAACATPTRAFRRRTSRRALARHLHLPVERGALVDAGDAGRPGGTRGPARRLARGAVPGRVDRRRRRRRDRRREAGGSPTATL